MCNGYKKIVLVVLAVFAVSCFSACKRAKQIPADTLTDIFRDMYELNAYMERSNVQSDSTDVYEPILERYGYTTADFKYTITEATKRKSFRLSDIVKGAASKLEAEYASLDARIKRQNSIDSLAYAISRTEIYRDSLINLRSLKDTARLKIPIKDLVGKVIITYYYKQDSLDGNTGLQNRHELLDKEGKPRGSSLAYMRKGERTKYSGTIPVTSEATELNIKFGSYPKNAKRVYLTIDSLVVVHQPLLEEAMKTFVRSFVDYKLYDGEGYYEYLKPKADSSSFPVLPPYLYSERDSITVE